LKLPDMAAIPHMETIHKPKRRVLSWSGFFVFLFLYRCLCSWFAEKVILRLTFVGDTWSYQHGVYPEEYSRISLNASTLFDVASSQLSTVVTAKIGGMLNKIFGGSPVLIDIGFQTICFVGLVYLLNSVEGRSRKWLALLVMLPSFSIWTSIASKEAIVAGALAILSGFLLRMYYGKPKTVFLPLVALATLFLFKPHYLIALAFGVFGTWLCYHVRQKTFFALVGGMFSISLLYLVRDKVDALSFGVQRLFLVTFQGGSSRSEAFFVDKYDVFLKAPLGMFQSFIGPSLSDITLSPLNMITFVESMVLLALLVLLFTSRIKRIPAYNFVLGWFVMFWIVFPNYPFGIMNVGTAIRYRSGWIILIFAIIAGLMTHSAYPSRSREARVSGNRVRKTPTAAK
jgi:hypothetical protein